MQANICDQFKENPEIKVGIVVSALAAKGIVVSTGLVYLVKGKLKGQRTRRRKINQNAAKVATAWGSTDPLKAIIKVKALAADVGGFGSLKSLIDAVSG